MDLRNVAILAMWLVFLVTFVRAWRKGKLFQSSARRIWLMFFLLYLFYKH